MKLTPGPKPGDKVHEDNAHGLRFCGAGVFVGTGKMQRAHVYTASVNTKVTPDTHKPIDAERLAKELEVDMCAVNSGRFWMMDELDYIGGDNVDFHGVEMTWAGDMTGAEMIFQFSAPYTPSLIYRNTNWVCHAGKPVYLLREPSGTVWVLQEYTKDIDPALEPDNLDQLGGKFKNLPDGWTFESKVLDKELSLDTGRAGAGRRSCVTSWAAPTRPAATALTRVPTTSPDRTESAQTTGRERWPRRLNATRELRRTSWMRITGGQPCQGNCGGSTAYWWSTAWDVDVIDGNRGARRL